MTNKFTKWLDDTGMKWTAPYTEKDLEKAYMVHAQEKKQIMIDCLKSLRNEFKGYPINGTIQGVLKEKDLENIIAQITKRDL